MRTGEELSSVQLRKQATGQRYNEKMATTSARPDHGPATTARLDETEPLLGQAGDASQAEGQSLVNNLFMGTAVVAQAGIWILTGVVWGAVFSSKLMLFSAHPLLNSAGILLSTQAILILQPTHTAKQKRLGTYNHATLNDIGILALVAGLAVILYNKISHGGTHFESPHAILGLVTYIMIFIQAAVGLTAFFTPALYGGTNNAKSLYKYHRMSGYLILLLMMATVAAATYTDFNVNVLHIKLWAVIVASLLTLAGIVPRIKKAKLGF